MSASANVPATVVRRPSLLTRLLALAAPRALSEPLVQADYARQLSQDPQLQEAPDSRKDELLVTLRQATLERLRHLRRALLLSSVSMASAVGVAYFFRASAIAPMLPRPVLAVGSLFCFATATLGRLGWSRRASTENTSVEQLDQRLFHVLYWIGMCWGALAIL